VVAVSLVWTKSLVQHYRWDNNDTCSDHVLVRGSANFLLCIFLDHRNILYCLHRLVRLDLAQRSSLKEELK
jgi:hypothetical protein